MPKVKWCTTKAMRREEAAKALSTRIDAECAACGMNGKELAAEIGMTYATYRRRRQQPQFYTIKELQAISDVLHLTKSEDFKNALLTVLKGD